MIISDIIKKYGDRLDVFEIELIIANSLAKPREFVLTHPETEISNQLSSTVEKNIQRRMGSEPLAYITRQREFYGLDFKVNEHTLIPRPETEMLVEDALGLLRSMLRNKEGNIIVADVGTGSGCIISSIANELENNDSHTVKNLDSRLRGNDKIKYYATDISEGALKIARKNAGIHGLNKKIKFIKGNLLTPLIGNCKLKIGNSRMVILANLPYLSKEIYESAPIDVKNFEPRTALFSDEGGLAHYRELLGQIKKLAERYMLHITCYMEFSPEQKEPLEKMISDFFPNAKAEFKKDLAGKWRLCKVDLL